MGIGRVKKYVPVALPIICFALLVYVLIQNSSVPEWTEHTAFLYMPYIMATVAFLLGWVFSQSRISFICLLLAGTTFLLNDLFFAQTDPEKGQTVIFLAVVYVPCLMALFYHLSERGVFTVRGIIRMAVVGSAIIVMAVLPQIQDLKRAVAGTEQFLFRAVSDSVQISKVGVVLFVCSSIMLFVRNRHEGPFVGPIICIAMVFAFAGLNFRSGLWPDGREQAILLSFMSGSGAVLVWAVLESSWRNAHIDELTELPSRRALKNHIARLGFSYAIAVLDVDHFKKVNDRYGHDAGDEALRFIASMLRKNRAGKAYRQGGEEFVIVCDGNDYDENVEALEDLRKSIKSREFVIRDMDRPRKKPEKPRATVRERRKAITITVSIGVARRGKRFSSPEEVLAGADKALYRAKKAGRDCVKAAR